MLKGRMRGHGKVRIAGTYTYDHIRFCRVSIRAFRARRKFLPQEYR